MRFCLPAPIPSSFFGLEALQGHLFCFIIATHFLVIAKYFLVLWRENMSHFRHIRNATKPQTSCFCRQKVCYPVLIFPQSQHSPNFLHPHQKIRIPQKIEHNLKLAVIELATRLMIKGKGFISFIARENHHNRREASAEKKVLGGGDLKTYISL